MIPVFACPPACTNVHGGRAPCVLREHPPGVMCARAESLSRARRVRCTIRDGGIPVRNGGQMPTM